MNFSISHIGINVTDLAVSKPFYAELFELEVFHEVNEGDRHMAMLKNDQGIFLTLWQQSTGTFSTAAPGLHHLAFEVHGADEVRAFEARLRERGAVIEYGRIVAHGSGANSGGIFFLDPDGARLEVCSMTGMSEYAPLSEGE